MSHEKTVTIAPDQFYISEAGTIYQVSDIENDVIFLYIFESEGKEWAPRPMFRKWLEENLKLVSMPFAQSIMDSYAEYENNKVREWKGTP